MPAEEAASAAMRHSTGRSASASEQPQVINLSEILVKADPKTFYQDSEVRRKGTKKAHRRSKSKGQGGALFSKGFSKAGALNIQIKKKSTK